MIMMGNPFVKYGLRYIANFGFVSVDYNVDQLKLQWESRKRPVQFEDGFLKTEPNIDFEKTLLVDCSKDHYDGGNGSHQEIMSVQ